MSRWVVLTRGIYGCDNASRPSTVSDGTNTTSYGYLANSSLAGQIVFQHNSATVMTTMSLKWIVQPVEMGSWTHVSNLHEAKRKEESLKSES